MYDINFVEVSDIEQFADYASQIWNEFWPTFLAEAQIDYRNNNFEPKRTIDNQIANKDYIYYYITCDSQRVGYIGIDPTEGESLHLANLYIIKECRHKGIGAKAFEFVKIFAREHKYQKVYLTVSRNNKEALKAYNLWGFKIIDAVVTGVGGGFTMDDFIMEFYL